MPGLMLFVRHGLLAALIALTCAATPAPQRTAAPLSADTLSAYQTGQAYERLRQDNEEPGICGVVLLRPQCLADLRVVQAVHGADSNDAALTEWLTSGDLADKVTNWHVSSYAPAPASAKDSTFAWWWGMGIIDEASGLPVNPGTTTFFASTLANIKAHLSTAPAQFDRSVVRLTDPVDAVRHLQASLNGLQPAVASPSVTFATGTVGDMQLGVAHSTVVQMIGVPFSLGRPETRLFVNQVIDGLDVLHKGTLDGVSTADARSAFAGDIPNDPAELNAKLRSTWKSIGFQKSWPDGRQYAFLIGTLVSGIAYNAAVIKNDDGTALARKALGFALPKVHDMPDAVRTAITKLSKNDSSDWKSIEADATAAELAIMQPAQQ